MYARVSAHGDASHPPKRGEFGKYVMMDTDNITVILTIAFVLGACIGSFVTMASYRLPLGQDIVFKPSYCPKCYAVLTVLDLVPILSWVFQQGKCRHCQAKISARYPVIELTLGLCFTFVVWRYGVTFDTLLLLVLTAALAIMIVVDLEHYLIPDSTQVVIVVVGLVYRIYRGAGAEEILPGMAAGLALGLVLHYGYLYLRKKDALGFGDVKFLCVAGSWLPLADFVPFLFFSGLIGTITGLLWRMAGRGKIFPFGPALACSLFINVVFPGMLQRIIVLPPPPIVY